jgi:23S rRNA pseudouridine1911/1915/1917 synthase
VTDGTTIGDVQLISEGEERLDKFLARKLPDHSRTRLVRLIEEGGVLVAGEKPKPSLKLEPGVVVEVLSLPEDQTPHDLTPYEITLDVIFEDEHLMVINKPRRLATHPASSLKAPSLVNALLARASKLSSGTEDYRPGIVHRLDKDTTGLLVVAKTDSAHMKLARQIAGKTADRRYAAVVLGEMEREAFRIEAPIARDKHNRLKMTVDPRGRPAATNVKKVARVSEGTLVYCKLETGRTHQIRVHLQAVAQPVLGDQLYGRKEDSVPLQLHAAYLSFDHPVSSERLRFFVKPPEDFVAADLVTEDGIKAAWQEQG